MAPPAHTDPVKRDAVQEMIDHWMTRSSVDDVGFFDARKTDQFIDQAWQETDGTVARRNDIVMNHAVAAAHAAWTIHRRPAAAGRRLNPS